MTKQPHIGDHFGAMPEEMQTTSRARDSSDTPRTDALRSNDGDCYFDPMKALARTLERELTEERQEHRATLKLAAEAREYIEGLESCLRQIRNVMRVASALPADCFGKEIEDALNQCGEYATPPARDSSGNARLLREQFSNWIVTAHDEPNSALARVDPANPKSGQGDDYANPFVDFAWLAWQAAATLYRSELLAETTAALVSSTRARQEQVGEIGELTHKLTMARAMVGHNRNMQQQIGLYLDGCARKEPEGSMMRTALRTAAEWVRSLSQATPSDKALGDWRSPSGLKACANCGGEPYEPHLLRITCKGCGASTRDYTGSRGEYQREERAARAAWNEGDFEQHPPGSPQNAVNPTGALPVLVCRERDAQCPTPAKCRAEGCSLVPRTTHGMDPEDCR